MLAPHCVAIVLGTNDDSADIVQAVIPDARWMTIRRASPALPYCDIAYLTPAANGLVAATYTMADYITVLRDSAVTNDYAMHDSFLLLGPCAAGEAHRRLFCRHRAHQRRRVASCWCGAGD